MSSSSACLLLPAARVRVGDVLALLRGCHRLPPGLRPRLARLTGTALAAAAALGIGACGGSDATPPRSVVSVQLITSNLSPRVGEIIRVGATPQDAAGVPVQGVVCTFISDPPGVASVDVNGAVTALAVGTATITATCQGKSASVAITVRPREVSLTINKVGTGTGAVFALPSGNGTLYTYDQGTVVTLTASPVEGSTFGGWTGACQGAALTCTVTMDASKTVTATFNLCPTSYCGSISVPLISLNYTPSGFGFNWSGSVNLQFAPAPRSGIRIGVVLNAQSISGSGSTTGATTMQLQLSGGSVACALVNPSYLVITDLDRPTPALAIVTITWNKTGCP